MYHRNGKPMPHMEEGAAFFRPISATDDEPRVLGLQPGLLTHGFTSGLGEPPIYVPSDEEAALNSGATTIPETTVIGDPHASVPYYESPLWRALALIGMGLGAYHGYKRNNSVGWAIGWAILGGFVPVIAIPIALAQGLGKPKGR